jgi:hypothetical protein
MKTHRNNVIMTHTGSKDFGLPPGLLVSATLSYILAIPIRKGILNTQFPMAICSP